MNVKEIAQAVSKDERTVQRWLKKLNDKMSFNGDKMSLRESIINKAVKSSPEYPADYNQEETLLIIEIGMGKNAAEIYRTNAQATASTDVAVSGNTGITKQDLLDMSVAVATLVASAVEERLKKIELPTKQIGYTPTKLTPRHTIDKTDYCTIDEYVEYNKMRPKLPTYRYADLEAACALVINRRKLRNADDTEYYIHGVGYRRDIIDRAINEMD